MPKSDAAARFAWDRPPLDSHRRALILFDENVASYELLCDMSYSSWGKAGHESVTLGEFAVRFPHRLNIEG